jgi:hypothetical protein
MDPCIKATEPPRKRMSELGEARNNSGEWSMGMRPPRRNKIAGKESQGEVRGCRIVVVGHSLGAAIATLASVWARVKLPNYIPVSLC